MLLESTVTKAGKSLSAAFCISGGVRMLLLLFIVLFSQSAGAKALYCPYEEEPIVSITDLSDNELTTSYFLDTIRFKIEITYDPNFWPEEITSVFLFQDINGNGVADPEEIIDPVYLEISQDEAYIDFVPLLGGVDISYTVNVRFCPSYTSAVDNFTVLGNTIIQDESCFCLNDAGLGTAGHFYDRYTITTFGDDTLTVISSDGAYSDDDGTIAINAGDEYFADALGANEIYIVHTSGEGYEVILETSRGSRIVLTNQCTYPQPVVNLSDTYCLNHPAFEIQVTALGFTGSFDFTLDGNPLPVFDPEALGEGVYTAAYSFTADDTRYNSAAGCTSYGELEIEIFPATNMSMVCNSYINIGLSSEGYYVLGANSMLVDPYDPGCFSSFDIMIMGRDHDTISCADIGSQLLAMVTDPGTGEGCFSYINVADKLPPVIAAQDTLVVGCELEFSSPELVQGIDMSDNCSEEVTLEYDDFDFNYYFCNSSDPTLVRQFRRRYKATDESGNISYFNQIIQFRQPDLNDLEIQDTFYFDCHISEDLLTPEYLGYPSVNGVDINMANCSYHVTYEDSYFPGNCTGRDQLRRTWSVMNPCTFDIYTLVQNVIFQDTTKPVINCLSDIVVYQDPGECTYEFVLPEVDAEDSCSDTLLGFTLYNGSIVFSPSLTLPIGMHRFTQYSNDMCGNLDSCAYTVTVLDNVAPVISCNTMTVVLDNLGRAILRDTSVNIIAGDCSALADTSLSRLEPLDFSNSILFGCEDLSAPVEILVRVTDIFGNVGETICTVEVLDTIDPILYCAAKRDTITCDEIPLHLGELFNGYITGDICGLDTTYSSYTANLNDCNIGEIIQDVYVRDISGNESTCTERVVVEMGGYLLESNILWPEDDFMSPTCETDITPSISGQPVIGGFFSCTSVDIDYEDAETEDDLTGCRIITRTWTVRDSCTYEDTGGALGLYSFIQTITARQADYELTVPADVTLYVSDDCFIEHTLPAPTALNCFDDVVITNDFDTSENAEITADFPVGITTITYTGVDACGTEATGSVTVTVLDTISPVIIVCPSDITVGCDEDLSDLDVFGTIDYTDNCSATVEYDVVENVGMCGGGDVTRTWTITDASGNTSVCEQVILIDDSEPLLETDIEWPQDVTLTDCTDDFSTERLGEPVVLIHICRSHSVAYEDVESEDDLTGCRIITRTWTVRDSCTYESTGGLSGEFSNAQTITVRKTDYELTVPADVTLYVSDDCFIEHTLPAPTALNCFDDVVIINDFDASENAEITADFPVGTTTITYTGVDACGTEVTGTVTITVLDTISPVIIVCPSDITVGCDEDLSDLDVFGTIDYTDNCSATIEYDVVENVGMCGGGDVTRTWMVTDASGNTSVCEQIIFIDDSEPLLETDIEWPQDVTLTDCTDDFSTERLGEPVVPIHICRSHSVAYEDVESEDDLTGCRIITRTWTVRDSCTYESTGGLSGEFSNAQTITVRKTDYELTVPADVTLYVSDDCFIEHTLPAPTALNCFDDVVIANDFDASENAEITADFPVGTTTITYTGVDACGTEVTGSVTVTVLDTISPVIIVCPSDITLGCDEDLSDLDVFGTIDYTDNCPATVEYEVEDNTGLCGGGNIIRTWTVTDASGNISVCVQIITVEGPEPLTETDIEWPQDVTISDCSDDFSVERLGEPVIPAHICRSYSVAYEDVEVETGGCVTIERTWTVTDHCDLYLPGENVFVHTQLIDVSALDTLIIDIPASQVLVLPEDQCTIETTISPELISGCQGSAEVSWTILYSDGSTQNGIGMEVTEDFPVGQSIITFVVSQQCFAEYQGEVSVTVQDTISPVLTIAPSEFSISCTNTTFDIYSGISATDACGIDTIISILNPVNIDNCGRGTYEIEVIAYDNNGNSTTGVRNITFYGTSLGLDIDDFSILPDTIMIDCNDGFHTLPVWAYEGIDHCLNVNIEYIDAEGDPVGAYCGVVHRQWIATSACFPGDTITFDQVIIITNDDTAPNLDNLQDTVIYFTGTGCTTEVLFDEHQVGDCFVRSWTNDSPYAYNSNSLPSGEYPAGNYIIEVSAENYCGTVSVKSILLSVIDTIAPEITCISDTIIQIPADGDIYLNVGDLAILSEVCPQNYLTYDIDDLNDQERYFSCPDVGLHLLTVWGVDNRGNAVSCEVEVTIADDVLQCGSLIGSVSGTISTINNTFISDVELYITSEEEEVTENVKYGTYTTELYENRDYKITPAKTDETIQGITILDVILLTKYLLNEHEFDSPYQLLAADIDGNKKINSQDLGILRNIVLGKERNNRAFQKWRFVPRIDGIEDYSVSEILRLGSFILVDELKGALENIDFIGVKVGDLNNTAFGSRSQIVWMIEQDINHPNKIMIYPETDNGWLGYQLDIQLPRNSSIKDIYVESNQGRAALDWFINEEGSLKVLSVNSGGQILEGSVIYIELDEKAENLSSLSSIFGTESILIGEEMKMHGIIFREITPSTEEDLKVSIYPNPSRDVVTMELESGYPGEIKELRIYDSAGRMIFNKELRLDNGAYKLVIEAGVFPGPGVYIYKVSGAINTTTGQIIRID